MRASVQKSVLGTVRDLHKSNIITDITLKEVESLCIPEVKPFTAFEKILDLLDDQALQAIVEKRLDDKTQSVKVGIDEL